MQTDNGLRRRPAVLKHDLTSILGAAALAGKKGQGALYLRLLTLISARYDWARGSAHAGHQQLMSLWSCDRATVRRTLARFRELGFVTDSWQGYRGQVSCYFLDILAVIRATRPHWASVGNDVVRRMEALLSESAEDTSPPLRPAEAAPAQRQAPPSLCEVGATDKERFLGVLRSAGLIPEAAIERWFGQVVVKGDIGGTLVLTVGSAFVRDYIERHLVHKVRSSFIANRLDPPTITLRQGGVSFAESAA